MVLELRRLSVVQGVVWHAALQYTPVHPWVEQQHQSAVAMALLDLWLSLSPLMASLLDACDVSGLRVRFCMLPRMAQHCFAEISKI